MGEEKRGFNNMPRWLRHEFSPPSRCARRHLHADDILVKVME